TDKLIVWSGPATAIGALLPEVIGVGGTGEGVGVGVGVGTGEGVGVVTAELPFLKRSSHSYRLYPSTLVRGLNALSQVELWLRPEYTVSFRFVFAGSSDFIQLNQFLPH